MTAPILFRVDAGAGVGLGHVQRCLALAEALKRAGAASVFVSQASDDTRHRVESAGATFMPLSTDNGASGSDTDRLAVEALAHTLGARAIVLDSYAISAEYLALVRASGHIAVAIDDLAREPLSAHLVINGGAQAEQLPYQSATGDTRFLLGPRFALLRPRATDARRPASDPVQQVLITVGGDDSTGTTPTLIDLVSQATGVFDVVVAVGPFSQGLADVEAASRRSRLAVTIVRGANGLADLIARADLAISAAGQTLYELAMMGTPTIAVELFDNQAGSLAALSKAGVVKTVGRVTEAGFGARLLTELNQLLTDSAERARLSHAGRHMVDGRGADRVAAAILELA